MNAGLRFGGAMLGCAIVASLGASAGVHAQEAARWQNNLSVTGELLVMTRTRGETPALTHSQSTALPGNNRLYSFGDVDSTGWRPGLAATLHYRLGDGALALRGFYLGEFGGRSGYLDANSISSFSNTAAAYATVPGTGTPRPTNTITISGNSVSIGGIIADYRSDLWGVEANYERPLQLGGGMTLRILAGMRYIRLWENLTTQSFSADGASGNSIDTVNIGVRNHLVGGQIGASGRYALSQTVFVDAQVAGGLYANLIRRSRSFIGDPTTPNSSYVDPSVGSTAFAQGVEGAVALTWQPTAGVSTSLGYNALWLNNVSVAAAHFESAANGNDRNARASSSVLFHGGRFAVRINF